MFELFDFDIDLQRLLKVTGNDTIRHIP